MGDVFTIVDGTTLTLCLVGELTNDVAYLAWQTAANVFAQHPETAGGTVAGGAGIDEVVLDL